MSWPPPTISDNSGGSLRTQATDEPGDNFHIGWHVVTIVVHDEANNENRCSFNITVQGNHIFVASCNYLQTIEVTMPNLALEKQAQSNVTVTNPRFGGSRCEIL